jgi:hypothetical protein
MNFIKKLESVSFSPRTVPWFLLAVSALTYGLFFWARGFYWDEAPWTYIYYRLGPAALTQTFSTSRPFWGMLYQITMPVIGPYPWRWQLLMIVLRWLTAVNVWAILRQVWPENPRPALWASLLFLVYPGLGQNFISLMYAHFYIILNCFLVSLYLSILALRNPERRIPLTIGAILLSCVNLITMEYFYFLEFFRYVLFWMLIDGPRRQRLRRVATLAVPYAFVFLAVTFWRAFFFQNQNASYGYVNLDLIRRDPLQGILKVFADVLASFWESVPHAWLFSFEPVDITTLGARTAAFAFGLAFAAVLLVGIYVYLFARAAQPSRVWARQALLLGLAAWVFAGGAFWLVGIRPLLHFSSDRFTMPFMLGSSLIVASLLGLLEGRPRMQFASLALLVGFSIGKQFQTSAAYMRDWELQRGMFWQMSWRIPALEEGTTLVTNDLPLTYFSDNSLSGPLNWIYSPPGKMNYILYFASVRVDGILAGLKPGKSFQQYYLATTFYGNTSQIVALNFSPPACLRILDPEIDVENRLLPPLMRDVAAVSKLSLIKADPSAALPESLYAPEASHGWCYYFEQADLARQTGNWSRIVELGSQAFKLDDYPNDPLERFPFIEGYAHQGNWRRVEELALQSFKVSPNYVGAPLCRLLNRIDREVGYSDEKKISLNDLNMKFSCLP